MRDFRYNDKTHEYFLDGAKIPSVTQILKHSGHINTDFYSEEGRDRGTNVHLAVSMYLSDTLDESSIHPSISGYFYAFKAFKDECSLEAIDWERPGYCVLNNNPLVAFGGTPDLIGYIGGANKGNPSCVIDIKTGPPAKWHPLQLAAYSMIDYLGVQRLGLYLKSDGTYRLRRYNGEKDKEEFVKAVWRYHGLDPAGQAKDRACEVCGIAHDSDIFRHEDGGDEPGGG